MALILELEVWLWVWLKVVDQTWQCSLLDHWAAGDCQGAGADAAVVAEERPEESPLGAHMERVESCQPCVDGQQVVLPGYQSVH